MPNSKNMDNRIRRDKDSITVEVAVALWTEGESHIAYCPALEISAYGDNPDEAIYSLKVNLKIFFDYQLKRGTLEATLLDLGWKLQKKPKVEFQPPKISNAELRESMKSKLDDILKENIHVPIPPPVSRSVEAPCY